MEGKMSTDTNLTGQTGPDIQGAINSRLTLNQRQSQLNNTSMQARTLRDQQKESSKQVASANNQGENPDIPNTVLFIAAVVASLGIDIFLLNPISDYLVTISFGESGSWLRFLIPVLILSLELYIGYRIG